MLPARMWFSIRRRYVRAGLRHVAQCLLADYLFSTTPANRVEAGTEAEDIAGQRALEKAGSQREPLRPPIYVTPRKVACGQPISALASNQGSSPGPSCSYLGWRQDAAAQDGPMRDSTRSADRGAAA
jgi:hypothetical protein